MAKGPLITGEIVQLIAQVYLEHPEWRAKEIQREVNTQLRKGKPRVNPDWPGLSVVQKELTKIRRRNDERSPESKGLDRPWSIGSLLEYDIPCEVIPLLLEIQEYRKRKEREPLTIHRAQWIARLHAVVNTTKVLPITRVLDYLASFYMTFEKMSQVTDTPLDTSYFDYILSNYAEAYVKYHHLWSILKSKNNDYLASASFTSHLIEICSKSLNEITKKEGELIERAQQLEHDALLLTRKNTYYEIASLNVDNILTRIESLANELTELGKTDTLKGGAQHERTHTSKE